MKANLISIFHAFIIVTFCSAVTLAGEKRATILYFNDAHELSPVIDQLGSRGGIARMKTVIDDILFKNPGTVVVFGGDLAGGSLFGAVYRGIPLVKAFNLLPVHLANFGQHDFDFGPEHTRFLIQQSKFTWLSSNLKKPDGESFSDVPTYCVLTCNQLRIGFLALTDAMSTTMPSDQVIQVDPLLAARHTLTEIQLKNPDLIVALTQMSFRKNEQLLQTCKEIDLVLSEERYEDKSTIVYLGSRPVITPCGNMGSLMQIDILHQNADLRLEIQVHPIDSNVTQDPQMLNFQSKYQDSLDTKLSEDLATVVSALDGGINTDFSCRWKETTIGNLITDAYRWYHQADIAVLNGGGIRANIPAGIMTRKNAFAALPFGNRIALVRVDGYAIRQLLEHGVKHVEAKDGSFLQVSGATYHYNPAHPPGRRIISITIGGKPIQPEGMYLLALPDFILKGGNDFNILNKAEIIVHPEAAEIDANILASFVRRLKVIDYRLENRIQTP